MIQPTDFKMVTDFLEGENIIIDKKQMTSNQIYVSDVINNVNNLTLSLPSVLIPQNSKCEDTFIWGKSTWGDNTKFIDNKLIGGVSTGIGDPSHVGNSGFQLMNKSTNVAEPIMLTIESKTPIDNFTIYFDSGWGAYGTSIFVNDIKYSNDDFVFTYSQNEKLTRFNIKITHTNKANYPLVILGVFSGFGMTFNKWTGLKFFEISNRKTYDLETPDGYGIVTQYGHAELKDTSKEIKDLDEMNVLKYKLPCQFKMTNQKNEDWNTIGNFFAKFNYTYGSDIVNVELTSKTIEEWQQITYFGKKMTENITLLDLLKELMTLTKVVNYTIESLVQNAFAEIKIKYCYLEKSNLYEAINKVLYCGRAYLFEDRNGTIIITRQPLSYNNAPVYRINNGSIYNNIQGKQNNKIDEIEYIETTVYNPKNMGNKLSTFANPNFTFDGSGTGELTRSENVVVNSTTYETKPYGAGYGNGKWAIITGFCQFDTNIYELYNNQIFNINTRNEWTVMQSGGTEILNAETYIIHDTINNQSNSEMKVHFVENNGALVDIKTFNEFEEGRWGKLVISQDTSGNRLWFKLKVLTQVFDSGNLRPETRARGRMFKIFNETVFKEETKIVTNNTTSNKKTRYAIKNNELMLRSTRLFTNSIMQDTADSLLSISGGQQQLELSIQKNTYNAYDRNGIQTNVKIDSIQGQIFSVGQYVEIWNDTYNKPYFQNSKGETRIFEIIEVKLQKSGNPLMCNLKVLSIN